MGHALDVPERLGGNYVDALDEREMPDHQEGRVLRSIEQNHGELSNLLAREMPVLREPGVWADVVETVSRIFRDGQLSDGVVIERYRPEKPIG